MKTLMIYGPGGPYKPMTECAAAFSRKASIPVEVVKGTPQQWIDRAVADADLIYGGAEYMLEDFISAYPDMIDVPTLINLYARIVGVVVSKDNPFNVRCLADLARQHIKILSVELEKMEELQNRHQGIRENISISVLTGEEGAKQWLDGPPPDAWITYESWHVQLRDHSDFVSLPDEETIYRYTPIALSIKSRQRKPAQDFINFIKSDEGREIFHRWGWRSPGK